MWNMFKVNNKNTEVVKHTQTIRHISNSRRTVSVCLTILWRRSGASIVNFEHISNIFLELLLLTLSK